jgi:hypothetical protein
MISGTGIAKLSLLAVLSSGAIAFIGFQCNDEGRAAAQNPGLVAVQYHDRAKSRSTVLLLKDGQPAGQQEAVELVGWVSGWKAFAIRRGDIIYAWDAARDGTQKVLDLADLVSSIGERADRFHVVAISTGGKYLGAATGSTLGPICLFSLIDVGGASCISCDELARFLGLGSASPPGWIVDWRVCLSSDGKLLATTLPSNRVIDEHGGLVESDTYVVEVGSRRVVRVLRNCDPVGFLDDGGLVCLRYDMKEGRFKQTVLVFDATGRLVASRKGVIDAATDGRRVVTVETSHERGGAEGVVVVLWDLSLKERIGDAVTLNGLKPYQVERVALAAAG